MRSALLRRVTPAILLASLMVLAATVSLGWPSPVASASFFAQSIPTIQSAEQGAVLLAWAAIALVALMLFAGAVRDARRASRGRAGSVLPALCVLVGVIVFTLGLVHHATAGPSICCGGSRDDIQEVLRLAR